MIKESEAGLWIENDELMFDDYEELGKFLDIYVRSRSNDGDSTNPNGKWYTEAELLEIRKLMLDSCRLQARYELIDEGWTPPKETMGDD